jgi:hypothetical protein
LTGHDPAKTDPAVVDFLFRDDHGRLFRAREIGSHPWFLRWRPLGQGGFWDASHRLSPGDAQRLMKALEEYKYLLPPDQRQAYAGGLPVDGQVIPVNPNAPKSKKARPGKS